MKEFIAFAAQWPVWNFVSVVLIVIVTQRVIAWRERGKALSDSQLQLYMSTVPKISELYMYSIDPSKAPSASEVRRDVFELAARFSIMGSEPVIEKFLQFSRMVLDCVESGQDANEREVFELATSVTCAMCCDIHKEKHEAQPI